jgi:hypothetical protein
MYPWYGISFSKGCFSSVEFWPGKHNPSLDMRKTSDKRRMFFKIPDQTVKVMKCNESPRNGQSREPDWGVKSCTSWFSRWVMDWWTLMKHWWPLIKFWGQSVVSKHLHWLWSCFRPMCPLVAKAPWPWCPAAGHTLYVWLFVFVCLASVTVMSFLIYVVSKTDTIVMMFILGWVCWQGSHASIISSNKNCLWNQLSQVIGEHCPSPHVTVGCI